MLRVWILSWTLLSQCPAAAWSSSTSNPWTWSKSVIVCIKLQDWQRDLSPVHSHPLLLPLLRSTLVHKEFNTDPSIPVLQNLVAPKLEEWLGIYTRLGCNNGTSSQPRVKLATCTEEKFWVMRCRLNTGMLKSTALIAVFYIWVTTDTYICSRSFTLLSQRNPIY